MQPYQLQIPAGEALEIAVGRGADYVFIEQAAAPIRIEDQRGDQDVILKQGRAAKLQPFSVLRLSHESGSSVDVLIYIGRGTEIYASDVSGTIGIEQAGIITTAALIAVDDTGAALTAQSTTRKLIHIRNTGASAVRLGPVGASWAVSVIELQAGEEWREEAAAGAAWQAITDTAGAANLAVMVGE
jgi:hypothetical protein